MEMGDGEAKAPAGESKLFDVAAFEAVSGHVELPKLVVQLMVQYPGFGDAGKAQVMHHSTLSVQLPPLPVPTSLLSRRVLSNHGDPHGSPRTTLMTSPKFPRMATTRPSSSQVSSKPTPPRISPRVPKRSRIGPKSSSSSTER